jgi:pimeloyl-ACP methyl ester carboxylesterase
MSPVPTNSTAFAAINLASISYTDETQDGSPQQKTDIIAALSKVAPQAQGPWSLIWGPGTNNGNLVYVAVNAKRDRLAVAIRGTVSEDSWSMLLSILQDADPIIQDAWRYPISNAGAKVAGGFDDGLENIIAMTDPATDWSLLDFLRKTYASSRPELIVTGHSLGGALATMVALWLQDQLPKGGGPSNVRIAPYTFAAPTAGNQAFANLYDAQFPNASRYVNAYDLVPMGYANIGTMVTYYSPAPLMEKYLNRLIYDALYYGAPALAPPFYVQTNQKQGTYVFNGPLPSGSNTFPQEVGIQHSVLLYWRQLVFPAEAEGHSAAAG